MFTNYAITSAIVSRKQQELAAAAARYTALHAVDAWQPEDQPKTPLTRLMRGWRTTDQRLADL